MKAKTKNPELTEVFKKFFKKLESEKFQNDLEISKKIPEFKFSIGTARELDGTSTFISTFFKGKIPTITTVTASFDFIKFINNKMDEFKVLYFFPGSNIITKKTYNTKFISIIIEFKGLIFFISSSQTGANFEVQHWYLDYEDIDHREKVYNELNSKEYVYIFEKSINKVNIVCAGPNGYFLQPFNVNKVDKNIIENYNDDFQIIDKKIKESLKKKNKGILLLHGKKGTGKSNYIRHLIKIIKKQFIYIPSHLSRNISETNFITFLCSSCRDSILIMEDVEDILLSREAKIHNTGVIADLLNMSDGLMSDSLNVQFICSFNTEMKNIDEALTRPGRLIAEYYFDELTEEKAAEVYKKLGKKVGEHKLLCDIYNDHDIPLRSQKQESVKIGFNR